MAPRARPRGRPLVTLASDLGAAYAAQMKAVLVRSVPPARIVDLAHDLPAHAVAEAAFVVRAMGVGFPPGTVHVVVVDPGVGGVRAPIVITCRDGSVLVGPDNGVLYPLAEALGVVRTHRIDPHHLPPSRIGTTFDGRDVFAPAAAALATGSSPASLGRAIEPTPYRLPRPKVNGRAAVGVVLHVDRFGDLITNVPSAWLPAGTTAVTVRLRGRARTLPVGTSYEQLGRGTLGVVPSSFGTLELSVAHGRAAVRLRAGAGTELRFELGPTRRRSTGTVKSARRR